MARRFCYLIYLMVILFSVSGYSVVRIALLESYTSSGSLVQYEVGGRFYHSAIWVGNGWLQSYPPEGVSVISWTELQAKGKVAVILELEQLPEPTLENYQKYLGKKFDFYYQWDDQAMYCSELIAKLLAVPTSPMKLNHKVWPKNYWHLDGAPGVSPDGLYRWAIEHGAKVQWL